MPADAGWRRDAAIAATRLLLAAGAGVVGLRHRNARTQRLAMLVVASDALHIHARDFIRAAIKAQTAAFQDDARTALAGAYLQLVDRGASPAALGLRVYLVRRRFRPPFRKHLLRAAKIRLGNDPPRTGIVWTRGKGVIGRCWAEGQAVLLDSAAAYAPYATATEQQWAKAPPQIRLNLSWQEFRTVAPQYSAVIAIPVRDHTREVRGCLVADLLADSPGAALLRDEAQKVLAEAAVVIGNALAEVPRWAYQ